MDKFSYASYALGVYSTLLINCIVLLIQSIHSQKQYTKRMKEIDTKYKKDIENINKKEV